MRKLTDAQLEWLGEFGERLKRVRRYRGINQDFMADMDVVKSSMSLYESAKRVPSMYLMHEMAKRLNCTLDYLYGLEEMPWH